MVVSLASLSSTPPAQGTTLHDAHRIKAGLEIVNRMNMDPLQILVLKAFESWADILLGRNVGLLQLDVGEASEAVRGPVGG